MKQYIRIEPIHDRIEQGTSIKNELVGYNIITYKENGEIIAYDRKTI